MCATAKINKNLCIKSFLNPFFEKLVGLKPEALHTDKRPMLFRKKTFAIDVFVRNADDGASDWIGPDPQ
ncbi:hypothetical protein TYRP_001709 [Tyrophagus putrescentiae]|nr:hypothetical protein TYRP_001709 [Tyrophagus putrescentiae]